MKILLTALALTVLPGLAMAECSWSKAKDTAATCIPGYAWDADASACMPTTTS